MNTAALLALVAIGVVVVLSVVLGFLGTRVARTTDDFLAASRTVGSRANAAAISGQYVAAAAFLGIAGAVLTGGVDGLWFPIGFVAGFLALLLFVAAPLRRSGAYTIPDFAEARLDSARLRSLTTVVVVAVGWLYLLPQLQAAGLALEVLTGAAPWVGVVVVGLVVTASVTFGGMRSTTVVQALRFWFTVAAIAVPTVVLLVWLAGRAPAAAPAVPAVPRAPEAASPLGAYSLLVGVALGTMGLPHVLVRFYTNPDGRSARRTTVLVLAILGAFVLVPVVLGAVSRSLVPGVLAAGPPDAAVLLLPQVTLGGDAGAVLGAVVAAGAFAALLAVSAGLVLTVAGVLSSDLLPGRTADFRIAAHVAGIVPLVAALVLPRLEITQSVSAAFAVAASTFCPLLVLGIWWRGLTDSGAIAGIVVGGGVALGAEVATLVGATLPGWAGTLLAQPALVSVTLAFAVMVAVSRRTASRVPPSVARTLLRLHAPERLGLGAPRGAGPAA